MSLLRTARAAAPKKSYIKLLGFVRHVSYSSLRVNQDRLMRDIHYTCQWGTGERWGKYVVLLSCIQLHIDKIQS